MPVLVSRLAAYLGRAFVLILPSGPWWACSSECHGSALPSFLACAVIDNAALPLAMD